MPAGAATSQAKLVATPVIGQPPSRRYRLPLWPGTEQGIMHLRKQGQRHRRHDCRQQSDFARGARPHLLLGEGIDQCRGGERDGRQDGNNGADRAGDRGRAAGRAVVTPGDEGRQPLPQLRSSPDATSPASSTPPAGQHRQCERQRRRPVNDSNGQRNEPPLERGTPPAAFARLPGRQGLSARQASAGGTAQRAPHGIAPPAPQRFACIVRHHRLEAAFARPQP